MYSALTPNPALKAKTDSLSVDVWFNHDTDGDYTLQSGDDCILNAALRGPYADAEVFAADCMAIMQAAADNNIGFTIYRFSADEDTDDGVSYYLTASPPTRGADRCPGGPARADQLPL